MCLVGPIEKNVVITYSLSFQLSALWNFVIQCGKKSAETVLWMTLTIWKTGEVLQLFTTFLFLTLMMVVEAMEAICWPPCCHPVIFPGDSGHKPNRVSWVFSKIYYIYTHTNSYIFLPHLPFYTNDSIGLCLAVFTSPWRLFHVSI